MKKLITGIIASCLCLGVIAYASFEKITSDSFIESKQISHINNDIDMSEIKAAFGETQYVDEQGELHTSDGIDVECSPNDLVKKYHISSLDVESNSLFDNISDTYKYYLPIKHNGDVVGMAKIKIGIPIEEAKNNISKLSINEIDKNSMIKTAQMRQGKWYVSSISSYIEGEGYLTPEELQEKLTINGITDVIDIKYVSIENYANEAFCIKTKNDEYVIPIDLCAYVPNAVNGEIYSYNQVRASMDTVKSMLEAV